MDGAQVGLLGHSKAPKRSLNLLRDEPRPLRHTPSTLTCNMSRRMFLGCRKRSLKQNRTMYAVFALNDGICAYKHSNAVSSQYGIDYTV